METWPECGHTLPERTEHVGIFSIVLPFAVGVVSVDDTSRLDRQKFKELVKPQRVMLRGLPLLQKLKPITIRHHA